MNSGERDERGDDDQGGEGGQDREDERGDGEGEHRRRIIRKMLAWASRILERCRRRVSQRGRDTAVVIFKGETQ